MLRIAILINLLCVTGLWGQISSDDCDEAGNLCPNTWELVNNYDATVLTCLSCPDDFVDCFVPLNSAWFTFTTTAGGSATLSIQNLTFDPTVNNNANSLNLAVYKADVPCFSQSYQLVHCRTDFSANTNELITGLLPNSLYYVVFSGTQMGSGAIEPSEAEFETRIYGAAVDRPNAVVSVGFDPPYVCKGSPLTLIADLTFCPDSTDIRWFKNNVYWMTTPYNAITTTDFVDGDTFYAQTSCYDVCSVAVQTNVIQLTVYDFSVSAGNDVTIIQGEGTELNGSTSEAIYSWSPPTGLTNPNILNPIASPIATTTYQLVASNGLCEIADDVVVTVISNLTVPNVFTPNDDGDNDVWEILGTENYSDVYVVVYDRSGQKVLEAVNYNPLRFWDGKRGDKSLPTSTYFYVITLDRNLESEKIVKGSVTIIR